MRATMAGQTTTMRSKRIRVRRKKKSLSVGAALATAVPVTSTLLREDASSPTDDEEVDEQRRSEYLEDIGCLEKYFSDLKEMSVPTTCCSVRVWSVVYVRIGAYVCSNIAAVYTVKE